MKYDDSIAGIEDLSYDVDKIISRLKNSNDLNEKIKVRNRLCGLIEMKLLPKDLWTKEFHPKTNLFVIRRLDKMYDKYNYLMKLGTGRLHTWTDDKAIAAKYDNRKEAEEIAKSLGDDYEVAEFASSEEDFSYLDNLIDNPNSAKIIM